MNKPKNSAAQKRRGCKEVSREFSFLCVLCGPAAMHRPTRKADAKRSAQ